MAASCDAALRYARYADSGIPDAVNSAELVTPYGPPLVEPVEPVEPAELIEAEPPVLLGLLTGADPGSTGNPGKKFADPEESMAGAGGARSARALLLALAAGMPVAA